MRLHRNCCGLDVHKKLIAACRLSEAADGTTRTDKRLLGRMTADLHSLAQWLCDHEVTAVAMELSVRLALSPLGTPPVGIDPRGQ